MVAGYPAPTLTLPARALHVALHAAHHGAGYRRPMNDLERALLATEDELWRGASALAARLQATEILAAGLRLTLSGAQLAARLGLPDTRSIGRSLDRLGRECWPPQRPAPLRVHSRLLLRPATRGRAGAAVQHRRPTSDGSLRHGRTDFCQPGAGRQPDHRVWVRASATVLLPCRRCGPRARRPDGTRRSVRSGVQPRLDRGSIDAGAVSANQDGHSFGL
jgi:hypothetical protein